MAALALAILTTACNREEKPLYTFDRAQILGEWTMTQVLYDGSMPNPLDTTTIMDFSGVGQSLVGSVNLYEMPDTGNLNISFIGQVNSLQVPVELNSSGHWEITNLDSNLVITNDTVSYTFKMVEGYSYQQRWLTEFRHYPPDSSYWADLVMEITLTK